MSFDMLDTVQIAQAYRQKVGKAKDTEENEEMVKQVTDVPRHRLASIWMAGSSQK